MTDAMKQPFTEKLKQVAAALDIWCASELLKPPDTRTAKKIWDGTLTRDHQDLAGKLYEGLKALANEGYDPKNYKPRPKNQQALDLLGTKDAFRKLAALQYATKSKCGGDEKATIATKAKETTPTTGNSDDGHSNPYLAAVREALRNFRPDDDIQKLRVGPIRSPAELQDLCKIDSEAFQEASIPYNTVVEWWTAFPSGLCVLFFQNQIMGCLGIWPLSNRWAGMLKSGRVSESQLNGRMMKPFSKVAAKSWYISGILLLPDLIGGRAIKVFLSQSVAHWLDNANIEYPCELLALGYSPEGRALLERFNFFRIQNAPSMPDKVPLYGLEISTKNELIVVLRARGLVVK